MLIKIIKDYLKHIKYKPIEVDIDRRITSINLETGIIVTHLPNGRTMVCCRSENDIRFNGIVKNLQQLKMILELIK